jgi:hypothetical protein
MSKTIVAIAPYMYQGINFKHQPYEAWCRLGGKTASSHYPFRLFHSLAYKWELPLLWKSNKEARLRFVQPVSIKFDTYPDYAFYEIIPFFWDVWPAFFEETVSWLKKHEVRTAIFTSSQTAERMKERFPNMNILFLPEGVDTTAYLHGKELRERTINLLEFGRSKKGYFKSPFPDNFKYLHRKDDHSLVFQTYEELILGLADAQITVDFPKCDTDPEEAGSIETLTLRYWESMLSRCVIIGRAPQELTDLIGYNPVIELEKGHETEQVLDIVAHIEDYQNLVDKNRERALKIGDWTNRIKTLKVWLNTIGYVC